MTGSLSVVVRLRRVFCWFCFNYFSPSFFLFIAAIARHLYVRPGAGVGALACVFGSRKNNGFRPSKHHDASTSIIRKALQALEKLNLVEKDGKGGRQISSAGRRDLDCVAGLLAKTA